MNDSDIRTRNLYLSLGIVLALYSLLQLFVSSTEDQAIYTVLLLVGVVLLSIGINKAINIRK